jgi:peptidyl-prolyl cis-trans isomerase SurA
MMLTQTQAICDDENYEIKFKINDEIITNFDIEKEANYLKALNVSLVKNLNQESITKFAQESLIKEKVKKREIEKYYEVNYESTTVEPFIDGFIKRLNLKTMEDFENYLLDFDITVNEIRKKLIIEQTWNNLIFKIYDSKININTKKINSTLNLLIETKSTQKSFNLSEIFFSGTDKKDFENKYKEIISSIEKNGFSETAILFSVAGTSKLGGSVGWINENQLSNIILEKILDLDVGQMTVPITTPGGSVILKVNEIKEISFDEFNKEKELEKIIKSEKNRQLSEFSIIHYKKVVNKSYVKNL